MHAPQLDLRETAPVKRRPRIVVLSPGFPVAERPHYSPAVVDVLSALTASAELEIEAIRPPPEAPGTHHFRDLTVHALGGASRAERLVSLFARRLRGGQAVDLVWGLWADRTGLLGHALARALGAPLLLSLMGGELAGRPDLGYRSLAHGPRQAILRAALARADAVTVGSRSLFRRLAAFSPKAALKAQVAPLGVPLDRVRPRLAPPWSRGQVLKVLVVADVRPVKRLDLLSGVQDQLRAAGVALELSHYGSGSAGGAQREHGFVDPREVLAAYAEHHVLLHPSEYESQGMSLCEAALSRLPIAALRVGVAEELLALGAAGALAEAPTAAALARAVLTAAAVRPAPGAEQAIAGIYGLPGATARFRALLLGQAA